ncbi:outer membrane protein assembly factor BamB family protein [Stieleria varia]|uniref:Outer membrane biogenesis protein BamB n=1 Tax=Stieleria varia TaxID=2528005 RepID=A0A5C6B9P3_9BACT|nr:PQQ-binding-like beta-propeller repeat protein [Stieleria varia]TWU08437.1 outer membrane biogenesis protein BamB [Stieleria varia]
MRSPILLTLCVIAASSLTELRAENWPHWRGDNGNGVSETADTPTRWSDSENVKWKVEIPGQGSGSPIVWEDKVFVVSGVPVAGVAGGGSIPTLQFTVFCFDRESGKELWKQVAVVAKPHQQTHSTNNFASASPCTDGQHVYAHFGSRGLFCYTMNGDLVWKRDDLGKMQTRNDFGEGSSPTLEGDMILVPWDHEGASALFALDKSTGNTIWKADRDEPTCWATPLVVQHDGQKQVIMNGQNNARSYDLATGKELWRCGGQTERPVASAVFANGIAYVGSGFRGSFLGAFRLTGTGDIENTESVIWDVHQDTPDIASPLLSSGRLYFYKGKSGTLTCVDAATGERHFGPTRVPGLDSIYASPIAAGGHVYLTARNGTTVVIKDAKEFEIVSTNSVGETVDATPAPVDSELFIRGAQHLFCISEG